MKIKIDIEIDIKKHILYYLYYRPKKFLRELICEIKHSHKYKISGISWHNEKQCNLAICTNCLKTVKVDKHKYPLAHGVFNKVEELK